MLGDDDAGGGWWWLVVVCLCLVKMATNQSFVSHSGNIDPTNEKKKEEIFMKKWGDASNKKLCANDKKDEEVERSQ